MEEKRRKMEKGKVKKRWKIENGRRESYIIIIIVVIIIIFIIITTTTIYYYYHYYYHYYYYYYHLFIYLFIFFFFCFFCFSLFKSTEICSGSTTMGFFYQEKNSGKMTLPSLKNIPLTPLCVHTSSVTFCYSRPIIARGSYRMISDPRLLQVGSMFTNLWSSELSLLFL